MIPDRSATTSAWSRRATLPAALAVAVALATTIAALSLRAPAGDVAQLALLLSVSGGVSLLLGAGLLRLIAPRVPRLRIRLSLAFGFGWLVALANVLATSLLMFISRHDLGLLLLLLAFATAVSLAFGYGAVGTLTRELERLTAATRRLADGELSGRVHAEGRDELAELGRAFDEMADRLGASFEQQRALEAARRDLVAAVSHDLRTPLATVRALVEAIVDGVVDEPEDVRRYHLLMRREIQHLSRLIDDLFELSQIESGTLALRTEHLALDELAGETVAAYGARARARGIRLTQEVAWSPGAPVVADPTRLERVLRNLLDNALVHTPRGGCVVVRTGHADNLARLVVADSGPGVAPADEQRIFERFYRAQHARARPAGDGEERTGAGLGLAIARGFTRAHQGEIWVEPAPEGGAAFHVSLPLAPQPAPA